MAKAAKAYFFLAGIACPLFLWQPALAAEALSETGRFAWARCARPAAPEPHVLRADFPGWMSLPQIGEKFSEIYQSGKRLKDRLFFDSEKGSFLFPFQGQEIRVSEEFLQAVSLHMENSLRLGYAEFLIYPDMGHAHFFLPRKFFDEVILPIPARDIHRKLEAIMAYSGTKIIYHTAERLKVKNPDGGLMDDSHLQWRYYTRNVAGDSLPNGKLEILKNLSGSYNTVNELPGHFYWGAGFYLSASKDGCIRIFHGEKEIFVDLSFASFP